MRVQLIKREMTVASIMQHVPHREKIADMKDLALGIAGQYDGPIRIEMNVNPEHTCVRMHIQEFDL